MIPTTISADAQALADRLLTVPVGETVSAATLSEVIGRDIAGCRHLLYTAFRILRRDHGAIFASRPRVGYQRVPPDAVPETVGAAARAHLRRTARRARVAIEAGVKHANDLSPAAQRRAQQEISAFALVEHLSRDAVAVKGGEPPAAPEPVAVTARRLLGPRVA